MNPNEHQQAVIERFVAACEADERVVAAFLGGSFARDAADSYSDLDLYLITADEAYDDFFAGRTAFVRRLGEPFFLKNWHEAGVYVVFFIFADGVEGELDLARESHFEHLHRGPYKVLLDKKGILANAAFSGYGPDYAEQVENLRGLINWFWHDLSHFLTAMGRGQYWAAQGALEDLRRTCVNLTRLREDFAAPIEGYDKLENAVPEDRLLPLAPTFGPLEPAAMLQAVRTVMLYYEEIAPQLARAHGLEYPAGLEPLYAGRLAQLS